MNNLTEKKKKKVCSSTTYTTGDLGYNIRQFNKRMGTYVGNDNNNPSTEEAKARAAAEAAAEAAGTFASQSPDGGSSISTAPTGGATGGDSTGASAGGGLGEAVELDEYKIPKNIADMISFFEGTEEECKDFIANKLKPTAKNRWISPQIVKEMPSGKYSVAYYNDDLITEDVDLDEASNLTPYEKMKLFNQGLRKENVGACGDDKLRTYRRICQNYNFDDALQKIEDEMRSRRILPPQQTSNASSTKNTSQPATASSVDWTIDFADLWSIPGGLMRTGFKQLISDPYYYRHLGFSMPGPLPESVFKDVVLDNAKLSTYRTNAMGVLLGMLLIAVVTKDTVKIDTIKSWFVDRLKISASTLKNALANVAGDRNVISQLTATLNKINGSTNESLTEAKRYVRRYYIRPQNIFCSNKAEILKALVDLQDENCSIYTLNNLGDEKDVTKLTNKDIIYYYDEGILYDKNHVKVMDYDLYIKHEEKRDEVQPDQVSDKTFADVYDDRITKATELEETIRPGHSGYNATFTADELKDALSKDEVVLAYSTDEGGSDLPFRFSDSGYYSNTDYVCEYIPSNNEYVIAQEHMSDDGDSLEGDTFSFSNFEDMLAWLKQQDDAGRFAECFVEFDIPVLADEDNPFTAEFPDIDAAGNVLKEGKTAKGTCCICGEEIEGYGNNPEPYMSGANGDRCCDACNMHFVIPARMEQMKEERDN